MLMDSDAGSGYNIEMNETVEVVNTNSQLENKQHRNIIKKIF